MSGIWKREALGAEAQAREREVIAAWPGEKRVRRLATRAGETVCVDLGPEGGEAVIALHGAQANAAAFRFDAAAWSARRRVIVVDVPGEPGLSAPNRMPLDGEAHALWLDDALSALGVSRAAFVGVSLGGFLALDYAVRRPDRVRALALVCPAGLGPQRPFLQTHWPLLLLGAFGRRRLMEAVFGPQAPPPPEALPVMAALAAAQAAVRPRVVRIPVLTDAQLRALAAPILAILGGRDVLLDTDTARRRLEALAPDAEVVWLADGRHYLPGQAARIGAFLGRMLGAAA